VVVPTIESGGLFFYDLFARCFLVLQVSAFTQIGYMSIKEAPQQAALLLPLPVIIYFAKKAIESKFRMASLHLAYDTVLALVAEETPSFDTPDLVYAQPDLSDRSTVTPRTFRVDEKPLYTAAGAVDAVYYTRQAAFSTPEPLRRAAANVLDATAEENGQLTHASTPVPGDGAGLGTWLLAEEGEDDGPPEEACV
jgi:hypothetical protein